jgi:hypothetical protein
MHQDREPVGSRTTRCDEIVDLIDAVLAVPAVGEVAPSPAATGLSPPAAPAMVVGPLR